MEVGSDSQTGKGKPEIDGAQASHSMDIVEQAADPIEGEREFNPAGVKEPDSEEDSEDSFADAEVSPTGSARPERHAETAPLFPERGSLEASSARDRNLEEMCVSTKSRRASIVAQDIPEDIQCQRRLLKDFYAAWSKEKIGPKEGPVDGNDFTMARLMKARIDSGLKDCQDFYSTADHLTSSYSQMVSVFLLCANAYPKHAPVCYTLAESCFKMAKISSQILSASLKLCHGFTMSLMISGLDEIRYFLNDIMFAVNDPIFWYLQLYSDLVEHVMTNEPFEQDEEFQAGYEQPPAETQISAFASVLGDAESLLKETLSQISQLVQSESNPPEQEEGSACDEPQTEETEFENSEDSKISKKLRDVNSRVILYVSNLEVLSQLLSHLSISEC